MMMITCAITSPMKVPARPTLVKNLRKASPSTTDGTSSGDIRKASSASRPRKRLRAIAIAPGSDKAVASVFLAIFSIGVAIGSVAVNRLLKGEVSARYSAAAVIIMGLFVLAFWWLSVTWLHAPEGAREVDLAALLAPYRNLPKENVSEELPPATESNPSEHASIAGDAR